MLDATSDSVLRTVVAALLRGAHGEPLVRFLLQRVEQQGDHSAMRVLLQMADTPELAVAIAPTLRPLLAGLVFQVRSCLQRRIAHAFAWGTVAASVWQRHA